MPVPPTPNELSAIEACREAARRYCRGVDRLDPVEMRLAYWPDATDNHGSFSGNAYQFVDHCMVSHQRWSWTQHAITNHTVELDLDGVHARGEIYNVTTLQRVDNNDIEVWHGRYLDRYEKRDAEWRIIERVCIHEGDHTYPAGASINVAVDNFVQGSFDRPAEQRPVGP